MAATRRRRLPLVLAMLPAPVLRLFLDCFCLLQRHSLSASENMRVPACGLYAIPGTSFFVIRAQRNARIISGMRRARLCSAPCYAMLLGVKTRLDAESTPALSLYERKFVATDERTTGTTEMHQGVSL